MLRVNYAQPNKIKGGDKGWATQAVWADADDWCAAVGWVDAVRLCWLMTCYALIFCVCVFSSLPKVCKHFFWLTKSAIGMSSSVQQRSRASWLNLACLRFFHLLRALLPHPSSVPQV